MIRVFTEPLVRTRILTILALALGPLAAAHDTEPLLPPNFEFVPLLNDGFDTVDFVFTPQGALFQCSRAGEVRYRDGDQPQVGPVLDLMDEVNNSGGRGLLGMAVHPGFQADGGPASWLYLLYAVSPVPGQNHLYDEGQMHSFGRLARYRTTTVDGEVVADPGSRQVLLGNQLPDGSVPDGIASVHDSHSIGSLVFADDGSLLVSAGDGGHYDLLDTGGNDPAAFDDFVHPVTGQLGPMPAAQDQGAFRARFLDSLSGKILRIDPESGHGYPSNPFFDGDPASNPSRVWAAGLRNPFRMQLRPGTGALDPALGAPNTIYVGDVGWIHWEEINVCKGGENFGWPCFEGPFPHVEYSEVPVPGGMAGSMICDGAAPGVRTLPLLGWRQMGPHLQWPSGFHVDADGSQLSGFTGSSAIGGVFYGSGDYPEEYEGRYFFADWASAWMKTLEVSAEDELVEVRDFAHELGGVVDFELHPLTGDIYITRRVNTPNGVAYRIFRLRYGTNTSPTAVAEASMTGGAPPLPIAFTGSLSQDPEGDDLDYHWDFGDGASSTQPDPIHQYDLAGQYTVTLTVSDTEGLFDQDTIELLVGVDLPEVTIHSPSQGLLYASPASIPLVASASSTGGDIVSAGWAVDLFHDTHFHEDVWTSSDPMPTFEANLESPPGEVYYQRLRYSVVDELGIFASSHVFIYPDMNLLDHTGLAPVIVSDEEGSGLPLPVPANADFEVIRDGDLPPEGSAEADRQYVTTPDPLETEEWIGFELGEAPSPEMRFVSMTFQEGLHYPDGGWFEDLRVEVRLYEAEDDHGERGDEGTWVEVTGLQIDPPYPFELSAQPGFDGTAYQTYELRFDPIHGDAIRMRGRPGGSAGFASVGELRFGVVEPLPATVAAIDATEEGELIARVLELDPPGSQGLGSSDPAVVSNGTFPPLGSTSSLAQYDTFHPAAAGTDWIGYRFETTRQFVGMIFQEGLQSSHGGWLDELRVQVRAGDRDPWIDVEGLSSDPPYSGQSGATRTYETFQLDFVPVSGRGIRIAGIPGGALPFISIGELRVFEAGLEGGCGWLPYGEDAGGANVISLLSSSVADFGVPMLLELTGSPSPGPGLARVSLGQLSAGVLGGSLLISLSEAPDVPPFPLSFDSQGNASFQLVVPNLPALQETSLYFQAARVDLPLAAGSIFFSNGLRLRICP